MEFVRKLPNAEEVKEQFSLPKEYVQNRIKRIEELNNILDNKSSKKILIIGPCSADREDSVLEYMTRLARLKEEVSEKFYIVPRIYTSKPRTNGKGYKGLVHRPNPETSADNIYNGIIASRKMHLDIILETGMFGADEMLYPEVHYYIADLLLYTAVGARSVENQQHRMVASGLDIPVGMKNPTSGDMEVMLNAIMAAQSNQSFVYHGYECTSQGNRYSHAILRGYSDISGKYHSNYHFEDLCDLYDLFQKKNIKNSCTLIDCNHANSRKHYDEQIRISKEILNLCKNDRKIDGFVKGLMIESYLEDGSQMIGENVYGKSITDACIGWDKTERLVKELADLL